MPQTGKSKENRFRPLIYGMGGGVLLGVVMGALMDDPALGMAFGLAVGGGTWYALQGGC